MEKIITTKSLQKVNQNFVTNPERTVEWLGGVNYENLQKTFSEIKRLMYSDSAAEIHLLINSYGGATGIGMSFYDMIKSVLKPKLVTVGSGDVDSSGIIVFLAGEKRYLTKNTTLLLHLAGRTFDREKRFSTADIQNFIKEDRLKDYQYACVISEATNGKYTPEMILDLMTKNTILTSDEALNMGLAHKVL